MVVRPESAIDAKGAIQTMKNKQFTVAELQEAINNRLSGLAGRKYEGTEFHSWINGEIAAEFEERGITELCPSVWSIKMCIRDSPLSADHRRGPGLFPFRVDHFHPQEGLPWADGILLSLIHI